MDTQIPLTKDTHIPLMCIGLDPLNVNFSPWRVLKIIRRLTRLLSIRFFLRDMRMGIISGEFLVNKLRVEFNLQKIDRGRVFRNAT